MSVNQMQHQSLNLFLISKHTQLPTDLLMIGHQHQFDVFGLRQDVSFPLQTNKRDERMISLQKLQVMQIIRVSI